MLNPRLASRYAKSILGLAIERGQLEEVFKDMEFLQSVSKTNREFDVVLKSPVISPDKKVAILEAVTSNRVGDLTRSFVRLLIRKGREMNLGDIATSFIEQYKVEKKIHTIKLTTAIPVSEDVKKDIIERVKNESDMKNIELVAEVDEELIGGFVLQIGDTLVDASIAYDLNTIRKQFLNNDFIYKIR